jgi:exosortase/archaeosortase family protein
MSRNSSDNWVLKSILVILVLVLLYAIILDPFLRLSGIMLPLQEVEAALVTGLQNAFGVPAMAHRDLVCYPDGGCIFIGAACTAIRELAIFSIIVVGVFGIPWVKKAKGLMVFLPIIFVENIVRISILYPLAGGSAESIEQLHEAFLYYGQAIFLAAVLLLWFWFFAKPKAD